LIDEPEVILRVLPIVAEDFRPLKARIESVRLYEFFLRSLLRRTGSDKAPLINISCRKEETDVIM